MSLKYQNHQNSISKQNRPRLGKDSAIFTCNSKITIFNYSTVIFALLLKQYPLESYPLKRLVLDFLRFLRKNQLTRLITEFYDRDYVEKLKVIVTIEVDPF